MKILAVITPAEAPIATDLGNLRFRCERAWTFRILFSDGTYLDATIPVGFICDLYSVPWLFRWLVPKSQHSNIAAWVHDWLFATVGLRPAAHCPPVITLAEANWCLDYVARQTKVSAFKRPLIYAGVSLGGSIPWNRLERAGHSLANPAMN